MHPKASIIDLFAGPGGLGEGFSAYSAHHGQYPFHIVMSVEKEKSAHKTLELRAFFRQFKQGVPDEYYQYLKGVITRDELFELYPEEREAAIEETLGGPRALGNEDDDLVIHKKLRSLGQKAGPWVVIGGPPCQAYSLVGRARNKGIKGYKAEEDHRHFLYEEYLRVLWTIKPQVFVMENVKGILSAKVDGEKIFPNILRDLSQPGKALNKRGGKGYRIYSLVHEPSDHFFGNAGADYIIKAEKYGIPQARHRVILLGVREDIEHSPQTLQPVEYVRTVQSVIGDLPPLRSGLSKSPDSPEAWHEAIEGVANKVSRALVKSDLDGSVIPTFTAKASKLKSRGGIFLSRERKFRGDSEIAQWFLDDKLKGFVNHESRSHIEGDLARYLFCSSFAKQNDGVSPRSVDFPSSLAPKHANWKSGNFTDRFKVQAASKTSSTITSHISKDGHYFIHPDPSQCRSLSVREAARLQTFPDNYFFEGNRTQQYVQVGNAVPPLLAKQIAAIVYKLLNSNV